MEENVLIKSYPSKKTRLFFIGVIISTIIFSVIFLVLAINLTKQKWLDISTDRFRYYEHYLYECRLCGETGNQNRMSSHLLKTHNCGSPVTNFLTLAENFGYLFWFILHWVFLFLAGIFYLIYFLMSHCNITVSDKNISGRTFWGKKVVLPIHMVSAYSISNIFYVVAITTASGIIKFPCIENYKEIANVLQELLNKRQEETKVKSENNSTQNNSLNEIVKLKELLDKNIITQEEFDAKKKQLLGL